MTVTDTIVDTRPETIVDSGTGTSMDTELRLLRDLCREHAEDLRSRALAVDTAPDDLAAHLASPTLAMLRNASTPARFRTEPAPPGAAAYPERCLARVVANLELARGDAAVLSANTGPSLAGLAVDALGSDAQQETFYRTIADGGAWTFFAMTEPDRGSDATAMTTRLVRADGTQRLHGVKRYIANAARGTIGVVFARTGGTALSIRAVLLDSPAPEISRRALPMLGLRGARFGELTFDGVPVPEDRVLGAHLPASRRGMWGAARVFNVMRMQIGAQALGLAFAVRDYVRARRPGSPGLELVSAQLYAARELLYTAAGQVDATPDDRRPPSLAKLHTTELAVRVTRWAEAALGSGSLLEHPLLDKWCRDACAFEFMDGTGNVLRLQIAPSAAPPREGAATPRAGEVDQP